MNAPLDLAPWVDRVQTAQIGEADAFRDVGLVGDLERLKDLQGRMPGVWLMPAGDTATASTSEPVLVHRVRCRVSAFLALRSYGDAKGGRAVDELRALRAALWGVLVGWTPPGTGFTVHYHAGRPLGPAKGAFWWEETFETAYSVRQ